MDVIIFLILFWINKSSAFNLDLKYADIISFNNQRQNYFGYSVLLQSGSSINSPNVIVGAPKSNSTFVSHGNIKEPGAVYQCNSNTKDCKQYIIDPEGNTQHNEHPQGYNYNHRKDGQLLGVTIDGGTKIGDPFVVCGPKWINRGRYYNTGQEYYLLNGICYQIKNSNNLNETGRTLIPLLFAGNQGYVIKNIPQYYYALGEAGISMHYLEERNEILLGAPGVLTWKGSVVHYRTVNSGGVPILQRNRVTTELYNDAVVPNPLYISKLKGNNTYLGYSISAGKFQFNTQNIWYVAGAPRGADLLGQVFIYEYRNSDNEDLIVHHEFIGDQMGAYFGASLLAVDITGDNAAELIVGAPSYMKSKWDEGCVFVYKNNGKGDFEKATKICGDEQPGMRFGLTISSIGDLNLDSYEDIAIAAPYEDNGKGAIYIFLGGKDGLNVQYSQKILASSLNLNLRGFGFAISKGVDIDDNGHKDMAIGAYISNQVVILKSHPVIKYMVIIMSNQTILTFQSEKVIFQYCISYRTTNQNVNVVETKLDFFLDSRAVQLLDPSKIVQLINNARHCDVIEVQLMPGIVDFTEPFLIRLTSTIASRTSSEFCPLCPVVNPKYPNTTILQIPFANGCGSDNICQPELSLSAYFENNLTSFIIGSASMLTLKVIVQNTGEFAYLTQLNVNLPHNVDFVQIPAQCQVANKLLKCLVKNILETNKSKLMEFALDVRKLMAQDKLLSFNLTVDSRGNETNKKDNSVNVTLPLKTEINFEINGKSLPDQISYVDENNQIKIDMAIFTHNFRVKNLGPSPIEQLRIDFDVPVELEYPQLTSNNVVFHVYEPEAYLNDQPLDCSTTYHLGFYTDDVEGETTDLEDSETKKRSKRFINYKYSDPEIIDFNSSAPYKKVEEDDLFSNLPENRTFYINCSSVAIKCMHITCIGGLVSKDSPNAVISYKIKSNVKLLQQVIENKDIILISSSAAMDIDGIRWKEDAKSLLLGSLLNEEVSYWIYILAVIIALIIIAIIVFVLYKLHFFNRPLRERLENDGGESLNGDDDDEERRQSME